MQKEKDILKLKKKKKLKKRFNKQFFHSYFDKKKFIKIKKYNARLVFFFENCNVDFNQKIRLFQALLIFRIKQNNLFVTLIHLKKQKVLKIWSCGLYKLNASKRQLRFIVNILLIQIFKYLHTKFSKVNFVLILRGMSFIKKKVAHKIQIYLRNRTYLLVSKSSKIFNGCRAKKIRRKKYKKFRVLK
jgi:hypothetical protein